MLPDIRDGASVLKLVRTFARCKAMICVSLIHEFLCKIPNPNIEIRRKSEIPNLKSEMRREGDGTSRFEIRISNLFRVSYFVFRVSIIDTFLKPTFFSSLLENFAQNDTFHDEVREGEKEHNSPSLCTHPWRGPI